METEVQEQVQVMMGFRSLTPLTKGGSDPEPRAREPITSAFNRYDTI